MFLVSRYAGWGRSLWFNIDAGTVEAHTKAEHLNLRIQNGVIVEQTSQKKDECTTVRYGQHRKTKKADNTVEQEYFHPGTLQAIKRGGLWKRQTGIPLCGSKGTLECYSTSGGAYAKEVFKYDNGMLAYTATRWRKELRVRCPDGRPWMVIQGRVHLSRYPIAEKLDCADDDHGLWGIMRTDNWNLTVFDADGVTVATQGNVQSRQKQGKWLEHGKQMYYLSGVQVSRSLYEEDPANWDGHEVLKIPNAQLRCSLLSRMGFNRLLEKVKCRVIDTCDDGGQLLEVDTQASENLRAVDRIMRMVKVVCPSTGQVYVLRVPPAITGYQQARQWTFGLRQGSLAEGACLELVKET